MYGNPLLNALFDESSSIPSSRLTQARNLFKTHNKFVLVVPSALCLQQVDPRVLYQDAYLLSHVVQLDSSRQNLLPTFSASTMVSGRTLSFTEHEIGRVRGFPCQDKIRITHAYLWNPGVAYISAEQLFYVLQIEQLLLPVASGRFDFLKPTLDAPRRVSGGALTRQQRELEYILRNGEPHLELDDALGSKRQKAKGSAILKPFLSQFCPDKFETVEELSKAFEDTVTRAHREMQAIGVNAPGAVHEYFEHQFIRGVLDRLDVLSPAAEHNRLKEQMRYLDVSQVDLPADIDVCAAESLIAEACGRIHDLTEASNASEIATVLLSVLSLLGAGPAGSAPTSADMLIGLLLLAIVRATGYPLTDSIITYVRCFSGPYTHVETGSLAYTLLTYNSIFLHMEQEGKKLVRLSNANQAFWNDLALFAQAHSSVPRACNRSNPTPSAESVKFVKVANDVDASVLLSHLNGDSCLFFAIKNRLTGLLKYFLTTFPNIFTCSMIANDVDADGCTLLMAALEAEEKEAVSLILEIITTQLPVAKQKQYLRRTNKNDQSVGHLLHYDETLIATIGHQIDWSAKDSRGSSPLAVLCCCYDHPHYDDMLVEAFDQWQKDPQASAYDHFDRKGNSLLHVVNPRTPELRQKILNMPGFDPNWLNNKGQSPLMLATKYDRHEFVELLVLHKADVWQRDNYGYTVFDVAKGESTNILRQHVKRGIYRQFSFTLKTSLSNNICFFGIASPTSDDDFSRSLDQFVALRSILQHKYPQSWVPPLTGDMQILLDPWRLYRAKFKAIGYSLCYYIFLLTSLESLKNCPELESFCGTGDWTDKEVPSSEKKGIWEIHKQKRQNLDGTVKLSYSEGEVSSIATFFNHGIEQVKELLLLFIKMSTVHRRLTNAEESFNLSVETTYRLLCLQDPRLDKVLPLVISRSLHPGITIQEIQNGVLVSQARSASSLVESLERPVRMVKQLQEAKQELSDNRDELSRLGSTKSWPLAYFEDRRVKAIQDKEAVIFTLRTKIDRLTGSIASAHDSLASELASFNKLQGDLLMGIMKAYAGNALNKHRDLKMRLLRARHQVQQLR